jgi:phosphatidate cytidylyltransferase
MPVFNHLEPPMIWSLGGLYLLLIIASVIANLLKMQQPEKHAELVARVNSWWVMILIFSLAIIISTQLAIILFALISFLALKEYLAMITTRRADRRVVFWAFLAIPLQFYWVAIGWYGMFIIFIPVYLSLLIPARMVLIGETQGFLKAAGTLHWGLMMTVFSVSHAAYLLALPDNPAAPAGGAGLLFYLVFLSQFNDVAQYTWGKLFGKHPVVPKVSPKKTVEGLLGGVLTTTLIGWLIAPFLTPLSGWWAVLAGLIIGLSGFFGDVVISAVKRDIGVKDSGNLIPGHGGIMDRIDSLTFTAPLFFHYLYYLHY